MPRYVNDPRFIKAKYESVCPETGKPIRRGDECLYVPRDRKTYHVDSKTAANWSSQANADAMCLGDAGW